MMDHAPLRRLTATLIVAVGALGIVTAGVRGSATPDTEVARAEIIAPTATEAPPVVPVSAAPEQAVAPTTATTTATPPPPPTTTPPTTTPPPPPTTAPPPPPPPAPAPTTTAAPPPAPAPAPSTSMTACEKDMLDRMNGARAERGTAPLAGDDRIVPISRDWSDELARRQDLQHNPDYGSQVFAARPEAMRAGENVGRTHGSRANLFQAFMESPGHRDAILEPGYSHAGVGCTTDPGGQLWVTVNFWG